MNEFSKRDRLVAGLYLALIIGLAILQGYVRYRQHTTEASHSTVVLGNQP